MDEEDAERQAEQTPDHESRERLSERECRLAEQDRAERRAAPLGRVDECPDDVPDMRQRQVVGDPPMERRDMFVIDPRPATVPWIRHGSPPSHLAPSHTRARVASTG